MARFRGAKVKISRNFGEPVMGVSKALEKLLRDKPFILLQTYRATLRVAEVSL